jgi:tRNA G10  N-methylase Trm11
MKYYFILGKNPLLSKAEIEAVLEFKKTNFKVLEFFEQVLIIETKKLLDIDWLNNRLGGTIKIGQLLGEINQLEEIQDSFFDWFKFGENKVFFGFSLYQLHKQNNLSKAQKKLLVIAMEIKRILREEKNINSRWVASKEPQLSAVIVKKNKLLKYGSDICFFLNQDKILVGQTLAVQLFEEFGARDYARPGRDDVSGMLPPKLAKIMVNLAQAKETDMILDPFCGSGTILQEATLMNYENLIGFDKSDRAVNDTKNNLSWLAEKYQLDLSKIEIEQSDVNNLSNKFKPKTIDHIITEPYLGPPLKGNEGDKQIDLIIEELENIYLQAFANFKEILKMKGKAIIVFPIFKIRNNYKKLVILNEIEELGFKILNKEDLIYSRPKQFVWREIIIFKKK